MFLKTNWLIID